MSISQMGEEPQEVSQRPETLELVEGVDWRTEHPINQDYARTVFFLNKDINDLFAEIRKSNLPDAEDCINKAMKIIEMQLALEAHFREQRKEFPEQYIVEEREKDEVEKRTHELWLEKSLLYNLRDLLEKATMPDYVQGHGTGGINELYASVLEKYEDIPLEKQESLMGKEYSSVSQKFTTKPNDPEK